MKMLVALTFTFLYCRRRYDVLPSVIGAISFGFGTFISGWLHYPIGATATFLPAVLYAIDLLAEKLTFARFLFAASLGPLLLSQGHPESVAHIAFFATFYALFTAPRAWRRLAGAAIVSVLLAAPILMPFLEAVRHTTRYEELQRESHADATPFSDFPSLALLVHPRLYGEHPGMFWGPAVTEAVTGFCGILGIGAWFGLIARRRFRGKETFFILATAVLFLVGKGNLTRDFNVSYVEGAGADSYALRLVPKLPERDYDWLQLVVDRRTLQIRSLTAADSQGGRSTFQFSNFKENTGLSDKTFTFKIPRGAEVTNNGGPSR